MSISLLSGSSSCYPSSEGLFGMVPSEIMSNVIGIISKDFYCAYDDLNRCAEVGEDLFKINSVDLHERINKMKSYAKEAKKFAKDLFAFSLASKRSYLFTFSHLVVNEIKEIFNAKLSLLNTGESKLALSVSVVCKNKKQNKYKNINNCSIQ